MSASDQLTVAGDDGRDGERSSEQLGPLAESAEMVEGVAAAEAVVAAGPPGRRSLRAGLTRLRPSVFLAGAPAGPLLILAALNGVDELGREAFNVLSPNIQEHYGLGVQGILTLTSAVGVVVLFLEIPLAHLADRRRRTTIAATGKMVWAGFNLLTGLAPALWLFGVARAGSSLGRAISGATHRALLTDYYDVDARPGAFAVHSGANSVGQFLGPLIAGFSALYFGWQAPFLLLAIPTVILCFFAYRLHEPIRGYHERKLMGADEKVAATEEAPASLSEAWRTLWQVRTLRRFWLALPMIAIPIYALSPLLNIFYAEELGLNEAQRGLLAAVADPFQLLGLIVGIPMASRLLRVNPKLLPRFLALASSLQVFTLIALVFTKNIPLVVITRCVFAFAVSTTIPALASATSLILPPRVRSVGFTIANIFIIPTLLVGPVLGGVADSLGLRTALLVVCPIILIGAFTIASGAQFFAGDIVKMRASALTMAEHRAARLRGESKLLMIRGLDVHYDSVQVLFNVDLEVAEGEIIALLGTNGAGKSTLLRTVSGLVEASSGAILFDGVDMTHTPPHEIVNRGVVQVPGGKGVFPSLTVAENLKLAGWPYQNEPAYLRQATDEVLRYFPILKRRWDDLAGNLSGGEQQMLTLSMAFIAKPRLLMIDELSLGLAPAVVDQLLQIVKAISERGTTLILVDQSVNVALNLAHTAYFLEKGEIRFHGPTRELLDRPDVLRSVFLEGAAARQGIMAAVTDGPVTPAPDPTPVTSVVEPAPPVEIEAAPVAGDALMQSIGLTLSYGGVHAVSDVSFTLPEGKILGLIGPNGAGKTSLMDLISGYRTPDRGRLLLKGRDLTGLRADQRAMLGIGRSFQDARLFPGLTVAETIALALERQVEVRDPFATVLGLPVIRHAEAKVSGRVDELIEMVGIEAFRDKFVRELSTGSRRIVDLCCVLAHEPDVIMFDEPSSGIAQRETEALGPMLLRIREMTGASMIVIEHDMPLITAISDELLALDLGRVVTSGPPAAVLADARVIASYLGTNEAVIARSGSTPPR
jgi:ABC-type branched-subunit amino acid transport system ATPase component/predicted MFS family arabinose efflux permease